ncbi:MAG: hypothetical protein IIC74_05695 [Bacteroidetes bacterium]|nr:hypothetical protein [Bacteroidota bacterium]
MLALLSLGFNVAKVLIDGGPPARSASISEVVCPAPPGPGPCPVNGLIDTDASSGSDVPE